MQTLKIFAIIALSLLGTQPLLSKTKQKIIQDNAKIFSTQEKTLLVRSAQDLSKQIDGRVTLHTLANIKTKANYFDKRHNLHALAWKKRQQSSVGAKELRFVLVQNPMNFAVFVGESLEEKGIRANAIEQYTRKSFQQNASRRLSLANLLSEALQTLNFHYSGSPLALGRKNTLASAVPKNAPLTSWLRFYVVLFLIVALAIVAVKSKNLGRFINSSK